MSPSMLPTEQHTAAKQPSTHPTPSLLAHAVLRTTPANYHPMITFYTRLLNATIVHQTPVITFLRYDAEHHRIAILQTPDTVPKPLGKIHAGLDHLAFTYASLADLARVYEALKTPPPTNSDDGEALLPIWAVNHGPTTSLYYRDPDGNKVELQVDNFDSPEAADAFMKGPLFEQNPIGADFEVEAWSREVLGAQGDGRKEAELKVRREIGARMDVPVGF